RQVAAFLRAHPPRDLADTAMGRALDVLEAPWPRREEALLREAFRDGSGSPWERSRRLVAWILATGLEPYQPPEPLPPIVQDDVRLVCWLAVEAG
ncbi:MAG: hypothetical protein K2X74_04955, partial [Acetobacteraceae bacterium]|nr:hypothetical protein [Acetobacteraceae bacterium]